MKIAFYSVHPFEELYITKANNKNHKLVLVQESLSVTNIEKARNCKVVVLFSSDKATKDIIKKMNEMGIAFITTRSAGIDHIDLEAAESFGIKVAHVPEYSPNAIAEHCIALTLSLYRNLKSTHKRIGDYNFSLKGQVGTEINSKTVGICGTGDIGATLAKIFHGFGAKILLFDAKKNAKLKNKKWARYTDKNELLKQSDIISLNLPLNDETEYFISTSELNKMKDSAILINTGRGKLVNTKNVYQALKNECLAGFAMDVYENEAGIFYNDKSNDSDKDNLLLKLIKMDNVVVTAHQAFLTDTALKNMMNTTFKNIQDLAENKTIENVVSKTS